MKRISTLVALAAVLAAFPGAAAAVPGPTPSGYTGAANMVNEHAFTGMMNAMSVNNPNGNAGMWCAVYITNGVADPGSCP